MWGVARWQAVEYGLPPRVQRAFWWLSVAGPVATGLAMVSLDFHWVTDAVVGACRGRAALGRGSRTGRSGSVTLGTCPSRPADRVAACGDGCWQRGRPSVPPSSSASPLPAAAEEAGARPRPGARSPTRGWRSSPDWSPWATRCSPSTTAASSWPSTCWTAPARSSTCTPPPVDPYDPEDLAVGADGTVWLADTGDNNANRPTVALLALRPDGTTSVYRLTYPDGPHDAEALLLAPDGTPYIVTKEVLGASGVYRPAAALVDGGTVALAQGRRRQHDAHRDARRAGRAGRPAARHRGGGRPPTAAHLALRTYTDAYVWPLDRLRRAGRPGAPRRRGSRCRTRRRARRSASPRTTATCWSPARGCRATSRSSRSRRRGRRRATAPASGPVPSFDRPHQLRAVADHVGADRRRGRDRRGLDRRQAAPPPP